MGEMAKVSLEDDEKAALKSDLQQIIDWLDTEDGIDDLYKMLDGVAFAMQARRRSSIKYQRRLDVK
jgi:hypothetical protein